MPRTRPSYPAEHKRRIIELARAGRTPESLVKQFEPSAPTIRQWVRQADLDEEHRPDVIVLDLGLEGRADDGKRVLARLEHRFPVVILTGRTDFDLYGGDWRELEALGARGLVIKGLAMEAELKAKVESVLASA